MLRVAGEVADGTVTWMANREALESHVVPRITAAAASAGRPAPRVVAGLPVAVHDDVDEAREAAAQQYGFYGNLPNYARILGIGGLERSADACIVGDEDVGRGATARPRRRRRHRRVGRDLPRGRRPAGVTRPHPRAARTARPRTALSQHPAVVRGMWGCTDGWSRRGRAHWRRAARRSGRDVDRGRVDPGALDQDRSAGRPARPARARRDRARGRVPHRRGPAGTHRRRLGDGVQARGRTGGRSADRSPSPTSTTRSTASRRRRAAARLRAVRTSCATSSIGPRPRSSTSSAGCSSASCVRVRSPAS